MVLSIVDDLAVRYRRLDWSSQLRSRRPPATTGDRSNANVQKEPDPECSIEAAGRVMLRFTIPLVAWIHVLTIAHHSRPREVANEQAPEKVSASFG